MKKHWIILLFFPLIMSGCGVFRKAGQSEEKDKKLDMRSPLSEACKSSANFTQLSFNANILYLSDGNEVSLSAHFRIRKDSLIWVSLRKLGFEGARMMLSKDSVWFMDRINNRYFAGTYLFFSRQFRLDADYNMVEAFLLGNPLNNWSDEPKEIDCSLPVFCRITFPERYRISPSEMSGEGSTVTTQVMEVSKQNGRLLFHSVAIPHEGRKISATYDQYKKTEGILLPQKSQLTVEFDGKSDVVIIVAESFKVNDPVTYPFKIPSQYKPLEIKL